MDALAALGRMSVSLVAVLGLLWLIARWLRRSKGAAAAAGSDIAVLSRQAIGHKAGVAVVRVGERAIVVGVTEHQVTLLSEVPLASVTPAPAETRSVVEIPRQVRPTAPVPTVEELLASPDAFGAHLAEQDPTTPAEHDAAAGALTGSAL